MKKISHYQVEHKPGEPPQAHGDSFLFHRNVVDSKNIRSAALKQRVTQKDNEIEARFNEYDAAFVADRLEDVAESADMKAMKTDLQALYDYDAKPFANLLDQLITQDGVLDDTCPNCDKDSVETFDHLLPQSLYPEFSDHPLNLMPCCSECNGHKSAVWLEGDKRKYLNLYIDEIPTEQFLFCTLDVVGNSIDCKFHIENINGIDGDLYRKISNHFSKLELLDRYRKRSNRIIMQYKRTLHNGKKRVESGMSTKDDIKAEMLIECLDMKARDGNNNWQALIYEACSNTAAVFDFLYAEV